MTTRDWKLVINPRTFDDKTLSPEEMLRWFEECEAIWLHDGDSKKPHALLTSGLHSNGFVDCQRVLCYPRLAEIFARQLVQKLRENGINQVDWVIGSAHGAITFSYAVANVLGAVHGFAKKDQADPKKMVWREMTIPRNSTVLQIEELVTTAGTMMEVRRAIGEGNSEPVNFLPTVGTLVHRPPKLPFHYTLHKTIAGVQVRLAPVGVIALIELEIWAVPSEDCELCRKGSKPLPAKTRWKELTRQ